MPAVLHVPAPAVEFVFPVPAVRRVSAPVTKFFAPGAGIAAAFQPDAAISPLEFVDELQRCGEVVPPTIAAARDNFRRGHQDLKADRFVCGLCRRRCLNCSPDRQERPWPHTAGWVWQGATASTSSHLTVVCR